MTVLCGSRTEVTWVKTGTKTNVYCRLDDSHVGDHEGRIDYAGALLSWPRDPTPIVIQIAADSVPPLDCPANPPNAACVIKVNPLPVTTPWATKPSSILEDLQAGVEKANRLHRAGPQKMDPVSRAEYDRIGALLSAAASRLPPLEPDE